MKNYKLEICIDSVEGAINAQRGGADRVELCADLFEGGITPSYGMLAITKEKIDIPIFAMLRPRGGDFCYTDFEFEIMKQDILAMKKLKIDGIVFGILKPDGSIDIDRCKELMDTLEDTPATFHRAFDCVKNFDEALEDIVSLGFSRILTSGGEVTALAGIKNLKKIIANAANRIIIMPGSGINERNIVDIATELSACEYHMQANKTVCSRMEYKSEIVSFGAKLSASDYVYQTTDEEKVNRLRALLE